MSQPFLTKGLSNPIPTISVAALDPQPNYMNPVP
jgi:hypothetical protein